MSNSIFRKKSVKQLLDSTSLEGHSGSKMVKNLSVRDLTAMGIAAVIGAGIFSTVGKACVEGGPAISLLYVFTAIACLFSALCYAEFASRVPVSGSAYTYAYTTFGELIAWVIGWNLVFEYAIGNITVAISWSDYFTNLLENGLGWQVPDYFEMDYVSASRAHTEVEAQRATGVAITNIDEGLLKAANAWDTAPRIGNMRVIADLPTLLITFLTTVLIIRGIKESKQASNLMVVVKLVVIAAVILIGAFYVNTDNWVPFAPNGYANILKGVSAVFFAYIGFDAISTTAEECKNPQRDLPKAMIYTLIICTIIYVLMVLVMTGMVSYKELGVGDPLAFVFGRIGLVWIEKIVAVSAIFAMASVFLVFQIGQPRIWMAMSRDGLLPSKFGQLHPRFKTPAFSSIVAGFLVAIPSLMMNLTEVTDLCSIGTLFAFALVSGGILLLEPDSKATGFKVPYLNGQWVIPLLFVLTLFVFVNYKPEVFSFDKENILYQLFLLMFAVMAVYSFLRKWSVIPVVGLLTNLYLMTELGLLNWSRFLIWCVVGIMIYFLYGYRKSKLAVG
ncbi:MAG: amino acid permease [Runella sp.]